MLELSLLPGVPLSSGPDSSGWSSTDPGLGIACDLILLRCRNSSRDMPKNVGDITYRLRHSKGKLLSPQERKKNQKVMTNGEAEAGLSRRGRGLSSWGLATWPCCLSQIGLVCGETTLQKISPKANVDIISECTANLSSVGVKWVFPGSAWWAFSTALRGSFAT